MAAVRDGDVDGGRSAPSVVPLLSGALVVIVVLGILAIQIYLEVLAVGRTTVESRVRVILLGVAAIVIGAEAVVVWVLGKRRAHVSYVVTLGGLLVVGVVLAPLLLSAV